MDYTASINTKTPARDAAQVIRNRIADWWSPRLDMTDTGFTIRFRSSHVTFEAPPPPDGQHMVWTCTDAHMVIEDVADTAEWKGTQLVWDIVPTDEGSKVTLTHKGLGPQLACFGVCRRGWVHFFEDSLRAFLNGQPPSPAPD